MKFKSIQEAFDEYVLQFDAFPDLIFMGESFQRIFLNENRQPNWKVLLESESKIKSVIGCKVILVPYTNYSHRFNFFEFDDLEEYKNHIISENIRKYEDSFLIPKNLPSVYDFQPWETSPPPEKVYDPFLRIPFTVLETFRTTSISKQEIKEIKEVYSIRKGIYEPEMRF